MEVIHGVSCIKGEVHSLATLLRLNTRWATRASSRRHSLTDEEQAVTQSFRRLNEYLEGLFDLQEVDCANYIAPFHDVIVSQANAQLTSAALSSLCKFALYGFFNCRFPGIRKGMTLVAHSIAHCVFEETDWESDELVLMKLLELSTLCYRSNASDELTVHAAWDIYCACISIHNHYRASKILKSEAENALVHLTLSIFNRASAVSTRVAVMRSLLPDSVRPDAPLREYSEDTLLASHTGIVVIFLKTLRVFVEMLETPKQSPDHIKFALYLVNVALEAGGPALNAIPNVVAMLSDDICRHLLKWSQSDDLTIFSRALRVVFNLFMSIKDHMKVQLEVILSSVHLRLLNLGDKRSTTAIAVSDTHRAGNGSMLYSPLIANPLASAREELVLESLLDFCREPSLIHDLYRNYDCDVQCSNLYDSVLVALCVNAVHGLVDCTDHDVYIQHLGVPVRLSACHRLALDGIIAVCGSITGKALLISSRDAAEVARIEESVDVAVDKWCDNLEEVYLDTEPSSPRSPFSMVPRTRNSSNNALQAYGYSGAGGGGESECTEDSEEAGSALGPAVGDYIFRERKLMKKRLRKVVQEFNEKPLKDEWMRSAVKAGIINQTVIEEDGTTSDPPGVLLDAQQPTLWVTAPALAHFLRHTPGLQRAQIGEYIGKGPAHLFPVHAKVLKEYVRTFDFSDENTTLEKGFRLFLSTFRLPGEAQCIDRIMEAFAHHYFTHHPHPFLSADACFILSFSLIMLNTDLHNAQIPAGKKMTKDQFVRNNRGINDGQDLPREYLTALYDELQQKQIEVDVDMDHVFTFSDSGVDVTEPHIWDKLINRPQATVVPAAFTPSHAARKSLHLLRDDAPSDRARGLSRELFSAPGGGAARLSKPLHASVERDMFAATCLPAWRTVCKLWLSPLDDSYLPKLLQCSLQLMTACAQLRLGAVYSRLFAQQVHMCVSLLSVTRTIAVTPYARTNILVSRSAYEQWRAHTDTHDLLALLVCPMEAAIRPLDRPQCAMVKAELALKMLLVLSLKAPLLMDAQAWATIMMALLWCRRRGVLPVELSALTAELPVPAPDGSSIKVRFPPSIHFSPRGSRAAIGEHDLVVRLVQRALGSSGGSRKERATYGVSSQQSMQALAVTGALADPRPVHPTAPSPPLLLASAVMVLPAASVKAPRPPAPQPSGWMSWMWGAPEHETSPVQPNASVKLTDRDTGAMSAQVAAFFEDSADSTCVHGFCTNALEHLDVNGFAVRPDDAFLAAALDASDWKACTPTEESAKLFVEGLILCMQETMLAVASLVPGQSVRHLFDSVRREVRGGVPGPPAMSAEEEEMCTSLGRVPPLAMMMQAPSPSGLADLHAFLLHEEEPTDSETAPILQPSPAPHAVSPAVHALDLCLCLEHLCAALLVDGVAQFRFTWGQLALLTLLQFIFCEEAEGLFIQCPMYVERCVFVIFRVCVSRLALVFTSHPGTAAAAMHHDPFWALLPYVHRLPPDFLSSCGPVVAAGVLGCLRSAAAHASAHADVPVDCWSALFSLLLQLYTHTPPSDERPDGLHAPLYSEQIHFYVRRTVWQCVKLSMAHPLVCESNLIYVRALVMKLCAYIRRPKGVSRMLEVGEEGLCIEYLTKLALWAWSPFIAQRAERDAQGAPLTPSRRAPPMAPSIARAQAAMEVTLPPPIACPQLHQIKAPDSQGKSLDPSPPAAAPTSARPSAEGPRVKVIRCVSLEDAQRIHVETAALLCDLCWAEAAAPADSAQRSLEQLLAVHAALPLAPTLLSSVLEELVGRLPLNIVTATGRLQAARLHGDIVAVSFRACNVAFHMFAAHCSVLRTVAHYNSLFIRFVSALVTNASVSPRSMPIHEEMVAMALAMLKLLRLPAYPVAAVEASASGMALQSQSQPNDAPHTATPVAALPAAVAPGGGTATGTASGFNLWGMLGFGLAEAAPPSPPPRQPAAPAPAPAPAPAATRVAMLATTPSTAHAATACGQDHDRELLCMAWKATQSLYSSFPQLVKQKDPQLHAALVHCMDHAPPVTTAVAPLTAPPAQHAVPHPEHAFVAPGHVGHGDAGSSAFSEVHAPPSPPAVSSPIKQLRSPRPRAPKTPSSVQIV